MVFRKIVTFILISGVILFSHFFFSIMLSEAEEVTVDITTDTNEDLVMVPGAGGNTQIGDASATNTYATTNDDLHVTGVVEVDGAAYLKSTAIVTSTLTASGAFEASTVQTDTIRNSTTDLALNLATGYGIIGAVTRAAASGAEVAYSLGADVNKTTSGDFSALELNVTDTASPGLLKLTDLQVGGTSIMQAYEDVNSSNYGRLSVGTGSWDGSSSGYFSGSVNGTQIAVNAPSGFSGNILDFQAGGSSKFTVDGSLQGRLGIVGPIIQKNVTIVANDTTPSVSGGNIFVTSANTGATAITDLDDPTIGQVITIIGGSDQNASTIADSGNFNLSGPWTANPDDSLVLFIQADNDYIEIKRTNN